MDLSGAVHTPTTFKTFKGICWSCGVDLHIFDDLESDIAETQCFRWVPAEFQRSVCNKATVDFQDRLALVAAASDHLATDLLACEDCLKQVKADIRRKAAEAEEDNIMYAEALERGAAGDSASLEAEISEMLEEERKLCAELKWYSREEERLEMDLAQIRLEEERLARDEEAFRLSVAEVARCQHDLSEHEEDHAQMASATRYKKAVLHRLKCTNVLNDMFHIAQDGSFVTINSFRMGRVPEQHVLWEEINAGWGQACLLLDALIKRHQIPITRYSLQPRGSYSAITVAGDVLQLHSSSENSPYSSSEQQYRFDRAMVSFLGCLKETISILQRDSKMDLPFKIEDCKVSSFSIRLQLNQDHRWTKALKYMLIDLKFLVGFLESRSL